MNEELRRLINNLTQDIINIYDIQIPIQNINDVVRQLGGYIEENVMPDNMVDGSIRKENDSFVISVSPFQSEERRKFTIAHELGHLFLHMGYIIYPELWSRQRDATYYRSGDSLVEYQANEFAAAFLMPKERYKEIMDRYTIGTSVETQKNSRIFWCFCFGGIKSRKISGVFAMVESKEKLQQRYMGSSWRPGKN